MNAKLVLNFDKDTFLLLHLIHLLLILKVKAEEEVLDNVTDSRNLGSLKLTKSKI